MNAEELQMLAQIKARDRGPAEQLATPAPAPMRAPPGKKFRRTTVEGCGRALLAIAAINAGEEVLREEPACFVANTDSNIADVNEMLAQIIGLRLQGGAEIEGLVHLSDSFRSRDASLLEELVRTGPAIARLVASRHGAEVASSVDEDMLVGAFCRHMLNSMTIIDPKSMAEVGMGLYPRDGALMNHSNRPNCWTLFAGNALVVRALCPIVSV
eukprot:SAG11_NODE_2748_length_3012_cov_1.546859_4_plen_213_part_00